MGIIIILLMLIVVFVRLFIRLGWSYSYDATAGEFIQVNRFTIFTRYNEENLRIAYVYLSGWMMQKNRQDLRDKMRFIHIYLGRHFKIRKKITDHMSNALRCKTDADSIARWVNRSMKTDEHKHKLLNYLIALCFVDGDVVRNEYNALLGFTQKINIQRTWLDQRIREEKTRRTRQEEAAAPQVVSSFSKRHSALRTLGLSETFTEEELKKTYRKLAKAYHPDKFQKTSDLEREEASKKFVEIQLAYEYLS